MLGFVHGRQHNLEEDGRKRCQEKQGISPFEDAKEESSFSPGEAEMWPFGKGLSWSPPTALSARRALSPDPLQWPACF